jgi:deoxyadenosine/deoxycytidine kinase
MKLDTWHFNYGILKGLRRWSPPMYIAIEGVIGVGKTTLARLLQNTFDAEILLEVFEENPFLSDFYSDRERYAFQTQIFFLLSRYHQQRRTVNEMISTGRNLFADYTFAKDALFARINLKGDELDMYYKVHEALAEKIQKPDLLVYLQASTDTLMQRIALRDRPYERQMEHSYIDELNHAYDDFFAKPFDHTPVLIVDTNDLNIIQNAGHLKVIENRIRQSLSLPPFQQTLPLPEA